MENHKLPKAEARIKHGKGLILFLRVPNTRHTCHSHLLKEKQGCGNRSIQQSVLDKLVWDNIMELLKNPVLLQLIHASGSLFVARSKACERSEDSRSYGYVKQSMLTLKEVIAKVFGLSRIDSFILARTPLREKSILGGGKIHKSLKKYPKYYHRGC